MCATINYLLVLLFACCHSILPTDGLPLSRWERGIEDDLIAGKDFLSVLMDLPEVQRLDTTTGHPRTTVTLPTSIQLEHYSAPFTPIVRVARSTRYTSLVQKPTDESSPLPTPSLREISTFATRNPSDFNNNRRLVSVSISSSVPETLRIHTPRTTTTTETAKLIAEPKGNHFETAFFTSEDRPNLVADANRHEFIVEEPEPITKNADSLIDELPANVQAIPVIKKLSDFEKTSELLKELSQDKLKDKLPPFHHTVIYHDNPNEQAGLKSVSYSTVIQTVPGESVVRRWKKPEKEEVKPTQISMGDYTSKDYDNLEMHKEGGNWESSEGSTGESVEPTERNWGRKPNVPGIYGIPEENYEIDEAVSVQTNGRTHGVQPSQSTMEELQKPTAKSKNGYVIEGRKERRYRVEERTPDGFIVGEFGIVNRDDGLLRGVRYTAEETINPKLIYDTLMKFLSL